MSVFGTPTLYALAADLARADDVVWHALEHEPRERYIRAAEAAASFLEGELIEHARDEGYNEAIGDAEQEVSMLTRRRRA